MHLKFRNVNDAFQGLVEGFHSGNMPTTRSPSRVGEVLVVEEPVTITYYNPTERVLFNEARDCNPFFHVFEALWMLAGRNDLAPLQYFVSTFDNYSDDGKTLNGAYGYRWRRATVYDDSFGDGYDAETVDQLNLLIQHLKVEPHSRRAVLSMWSVEDDLMKIGSLYPCTYSGKGCNNGKWENGRGRAMLEADADCPICKGSGFQPASRDVCCNTQVYFLMRDIYGPEHSAPSGSQDRLVLDMTVTNRSNDLVWGALGANVVHFSFLQEYMAACLGVGVGVYNQFTNNLHAYTERWEPEKWLPPANRDMFSPPLSVAYQFGMKLVPLVKDPETFDREVQTFIDYPEGVYTEPFLRDVASPMCLAFRHHKERNYIQALEAVQYIKADDWRMAAHAWITKRQTNYERKKSRGVQDS